MTKGKHKNSGQALSPPVSPASATDLTAKPEPSGLLGILSLLPIPASLTAGPPRSNPLPPPPGTFTKSQKSSMSLLVQMLPHDLRVFLDSNYEAKYKYILKAQFYRILIHLNPATKSLITHRKDVDWHQIPAAGKLHSRVAQ